MNRYAIPDLDLRLKLGSIGLECHLLTAKLDDATGQADFPALLCSEVETVVESAYSLPLSPAHFQCVTWGVTLRFIEAPADVVAFTALTFYSDFPSYFHTRFEAVALNHQRKGLGRLLYECVAVWARFLILNDPLVLDGILQARGDYCIVSTIDSDEAVSDDEDVDVTSTKTYLHDDNKAGHGTFLKKIGFVRALHDFRQDPDTEIAFQLAFSVPVCDEFETVSRSLSSPLLDSSGSPAPIETSSTTAVVL